MFKLDLEKAEKLEIKLPTSVRSLKKQESSRKISSSALLTMPKPLTMWTTTNCGKFWERWEPDHLTCFLRNLFADQEATVRTGHGKMDWFKIGKAVRRGLFKITLLFKKQRCYFAYKGLYNQNYGFSSSHEQMWELDIKKGWVLKNWCFWTMVLEKMLESPLDCRIS